jgi:transposase
MDKRVTFNMKEIKRLHLIQQILDRHMTAQQATELLGLSLRQVRRLVAKYREKGANGITHGNCGKTPNNQIERNIRDKIIKLAETEYLDYNDSHFTEELEEKYGVCVSRSTVRRIRRARPTLGVLGNVERLAIAAAGLDQAEGMQVFNGWRDIFIRAARNGAEPALADGLPVQAQHIT